jgi:ATP-dependent exoDNAse (exonuclease V) alpha subunit
MPGRQFTTAKTIAAEQEIVRRVLEGQNHLEPVFSRPQAIAVTDQQPRLNSTQKSVVEDVLSSPDRIQAIQGNAGSGKTTTLTTLRSAIELQGYEVQGFAPTSRAARQLREAGIEAGTLQGFVARSAQSDQMPEHRLFYFVDESNLASTNQMRELLARLSPNDRVLLIGDMRQHQGVEAGSPSSICSRPECERPSSMKLSDRKIRHSNPLSSYLRRDSLLPL